MRALVLTRFETNSLNIASVFPPVAVRCPNPSCHGELEEAALSRRGRVWSFTINHYAPPPPYAAAV